MSNLLTFCVADIVTSRNQAVSIGRTRAEISVLVLTDTKVDDFLWPWTATRWILSEFHGISQIWEATTAKWMTVNPYCLWQRCNPLNLLFTIMFLALICRRFLGASYMHCCRTLTLALARLSSSFLYTTTYMSCLLWGCTRSYCTCDVCRPHWWHQR